MSTLVVGEVLGITTRQAGKPGNQWEETVVVVLDGMRTEQVPIASVDKFRGAIPQAGEVVALEVAVRAFKRKDESVGYGYTAFGRSERVEAALESVKA